MDRALVFGGAFDPPHSEHVRLAKEAARELGIHRLVIAPTYTPPHKEGSWLDFDVRAELCRIAFGDVCDEVIVDSIEFDRKRDNYAALVLPVLKEKYGDIVYLVGSDSLDYLEQWYMPKKLVATCPIAVALRESAGYTEERLKSKIAELESSIGGEYIRLDVIGRHMSSSRLRAQLLIGDMSGLDDKVAEYVVEHGLFGEYKEIVDRLRGYQSEELFAHSKAVTYTAAELNSEFRLGVPFKKLFLAALLHDNAKQRKSIDGLDVPSDSIGTSVLHQFLGAEKARRDFGINDEEILNAIRYHTTARANMSLFERLVYTADSVSYDRDYEPIPALRRIAFDDFEKGFRAVLEYTYNKLSSNNLPIYPLTIEAYNYYIKNISA